MESIMSSLSGMLLLLAALLLWRGARVARGSHAGADLGQWDELRQIVERNQRDCRTAIDQLQRRIEALRNPESLAEPRRLDLAEPSQAESPEKFQAAALLLAGGQAPERVAALLGLPVRQVELVNELQKIARPADAVKVPKSVRVAKSRARPAKKKSPSSATGKPARPILLTDVVRLDGAMADNAEAAA